MSTLTMGYHKIRGCAADKYARAYTARNILMRDAHLLKSHTQRCNAFLSSRLGAPLRMMCYYKEQSFNNIAYASDMKETWCVVCASV